MDDIVLVGQVGVDRVGLSLTKLADLLQRELLVMRH